MDFLVSMKVLHGDLAARNILLCENNIVKISDFGLSRSLYQSGYYKKECKTVLIIPYKWVAIESIRNHKFSIHYDVWSFGILLWELFTLGTEPYPGMDVNEVFFNQLEKEHYRMSKPEFANGIMSICWKKEPKARPTFKSQGDFFGTFLDEGVKNEYKRLCNEHLNDGLKDKKILLYKL